MEAIARGLVVYGFLLVLFRLAGKRTLSNATNFDLVLLLIISETTQQAMVNDDPSLVNCGVLILTLIGADILLSLLKQWNPRIEAWVDGSPLIVVKDGKPLASRLNQERIDESDILEAAREQQGLERMEQIKYAVLERNGKITVVPGSKQEAG
jgi:uncharacterized membrane protein YcaP (DUF421 family)